jgi:predicted enzyme related to lactoylglutathione lyase
MGKAFEATRDLIVRATNLASAKAFYGGVMGLTLVSESDALLCFEAGAIRLYVEPGEVSGPVAEFLVADLETAKADLVAAGCAVVEEDAGVPRLYLRDPFGFVFNLSRRR